MLSSSLANSDRSKTPIGPQDVGEVRYIQYGFGNVGCATSGLQDARQSILPRDEFRVQTISRCDITATAVWYSRIDLKQRK